LTLEAEANEKKEIRYGCIYVQNGVKIKIKQIKKEEVEECFEKNHII
jgi:hypothetical protein